MSSSCSEKNSATRFPVPSLHRALAHSHASSWPWSNSSFSRRSASICSLLSALSVPCPCACRVCLCCGNKKGRRENPGGLGALLRRCRVLTRRIASWAPWPLDVVVNAERPLGGVRCGTGHRRKVLRRGEHGRTHARETAIAAALLGRVLPGHYS